MREPEVRRKALLCSPKRRKQPERCTPLNHKFFRKNMKIFDNVKMGLYIIIDPRFWIIN
jgi:hypothetical protein